MKNDCLFCAIIDGEIPSNKVYEDEQCYAFYDIAPQAPTHFLVVPKGYDLASGLKKKANRRISKNIHPRGWIFLSEQEVRRITAPIPFCTMCACRRRDT